MKKSELYKHVDPEVVEVLRDSYEKVTILLASMNDLIASQHYEAATVVGMRLDQVSNDYQQLLKELQAAAERHLAPPPAPALQGAAGQAVSIAHMVQSSGADQAPPGNPEAP
jgi:hypothetical protein